MKRVFIVLALLGVFLLPALLKCDAALASGGNLSPPGEQQGIEVPDHGSGHDNNGLCGDGNEGDPDDMGGGLRGTTGNPIKDKKGGLKELPAVISELAQYVHAVFMLVR